MTFASDERTIRNETGVPRLVFVEPWGMPLTLLPNAAFRIVATSQQEGVLELAEDNEGITVWAWPGSTAKVFLGDQLVHAFDSQVPEVPNGMSIQAFLAGAGLSKIR